MPQIPICNKILSEWQKCRAERDLYVLYSVIFNTETGPKITSWMHYRAVSCTSNLSLKGALKTYTFFFFFEITFKIMISEPLTILSVCMCECICSILSATFLKLIKWLDIIPQMLSSRNKQGRIPYKAGAL